MTHSSKEPGLLRHRAFAPLFWTQFLGAFNDNLFKNALVISITFAGISYFGVSPEQLVALAGGVFILPFFLFSALAGQLADKLPKTTLVRWVKVAEIAVMALGALGFVLEEVGLLFAALFLMGLQSTLFGPLKYGVLPEMLPQERLVAGNALIELGTFLAILLGTIAGGTLIAMGGNGPLSVAVASLVVAALGAITARRMPPLPAAAPELRVRYGLIRPTADLLRVAKENRSVFQSILGISWFWLVGAVVLSVLPALVTHHLGGNEAVVTYLLALFSIGVGVGSIVCEKLSFEKLELGLVPIGSLGISLFLGATALALGGEHTAATPRNVTELLGSAQGIWVSLHLSLFSLFSGFFIVPLYTLLQERSPERVRARVIAANNVMNAAFMVAGAIGLAFSFSVGATIPLILGAVALLNLAVSAYIYSIIPEFVFRFLCFCLAHVLYRLRIVGRANIPTEGPAVLVANHVTFIDWLLISAVTQRPIRFVMHARFARLPGLGWFFRDAKVIPIAGAKEDPSLLDAAYDRISETLREGELVCIFPEGKLTLDGLVAPFRRGIERIVERDPVPVIPMHLEGLWQSFFSMHAPRRPFRRIWSRVGLRVGPAVPPGHATAELLEARVRALGNLPPAAAEGIPAE